MDQETRERLFKGKKRKELLKKLTKEIKTAVKNQTPRYYLIFGPRGVGKTHFITLLYHNVEEHVADSKPVKFSEEEFSLYRVSHLLLRLLEMLEIDVSAFEKMSEDEIVVAALDELKSQNKMIVLFLENLNQLLGEQMDKSEVQRLRSIFQTENMFTVVTTAPLMFPEVSDHEEPFFNFFEYIYLGELTRAELKELVKEIATIENDEAFLSKLDEYTQKLDAVYVLTGGSPRMALLLYDLMSKGNLVDVEIALFKLLDENTPYYQDIFRSLSAVPRRVFDTLIELGKPATPTEIAEKARMDNKTVNTLLRRLEKDGLVRSRKRGRSTRYEVREQLFRLWRELRREPFAKQRLSIFINFLELWYTVEERKEKFMELFGRLKEALDKTREREASYWFLSLPKGYKRELMPQVIEESYEVGKAKLLNELIYGDGGLKIVALATEVKILLEKKNYAELLNRAEEILNEEENDAIAWGVKGVALSYLEKYDVALQALSRSIEIDSELDFAWSHKGVALMMLDEPEEALQAFSKATTLNPEDASAWYFKGGLSLDLKRPEEALQAFSKITELSPQVPEGWSGRATSLKQLGRLEEALVAISKAIELEPEDAQSWHEKSEVLLKFGRFEEALESISKAIELDPKNAGFWADKGALLTSIGRSEEALETISKAIELDSEFIDAWAVKGVVLVKLGNEELALEGFSKAIEFDPEFADIWLLKGYVHFTMSSREFGRHNYGSATEHLNSAMDSLEGYKRNSENTEWAKNKIKGVIMKFLKDLIDTENVEAVMTALKALFKKEGETLEELFEPIFVAIEIVKSKDVNKYYDLQVERREVVADIVKKLTGSEELVPEEYRS